MRAIFASIAAILLLGAAPAPLDSQVVLVRYAAALANLKSPKNLTFTYSLSQAGPRNIEQTHRIYRSEERVRDETLAVDGQSLKHKVVRIARYADRYAVARLAPREAEYTLLFMSANRTGSRYRYTYETIPAIKSAAFSVSAVTIDGATYLPSEIVFRTSNGTFAGAGRVSYGAAGTHWVPMLASVTATIRGKPARERIVFSGYAFPGRFPASTFQVAQPLPGTVTPKP
ncbi:MAG: hypothetical protein ACREP1_03875 [Rhodanobacteraceae bacterium]